MKIKEGSLLRSIAGQSVVIPVGGELDMNMMITLNDTGKFLWEKLQTDTTEADLVKALLAEYDVSESTAAASVAAFVKKLEDSKLLA